MAQGDRQDRRKPEQLLAFFDFPAEHWIHLKTTNPIESTFATVRLRTKVTKGPGSKTAGLAMAYKLIDAAQARWRAVNAPHLVALVRAGAKFEKGVMVERPDEARTKRSPRNRSNSHPQVLTISPGCCAKGQRCPTTGGTSPLAIRPRGLGNPGCWSPLGTPGKRPGRSSWGCATQGPCLDSNRSLDCGTTPVELTRTRSSPRPTTSSSHRRRAILARRHSANAVRVELPEQDTRARLDRYQNAAHLLDEWQEDGKLRRDPNPSFYAYRMTPPGGGVQTTGIIGALAMDTDGSGDVLPHEETLPKPKSDRLELLRATNAEPVPHLGPLAHTRPVEDLRHRLPARRGRHGRRGGPPRALGDRRRGDHRRGHSGGWRLARRHCGRPPPLRDVAGLPARASGRRGATPTPAPTAATTSIWSWPS